jgi:hypothetical protein
MPSFCTRASARWSLPISQPFPMPFHGKVRTPCSLFLQGANTTNIASHRKSRSCILWPCFSSGAGTLGSHFTARGSIPSSLKSNPLIFELVPSTFPANCYSTLAPGPSIAVPGVCVSPERAVQYHISSVEGFRSGQALGCPWSEWDGATVVSDFGPSSLCPSSVMQNIHAAPYMMESASINDRNSITVLVRPAVTTITTTTSTTYAV